MKSWFNWRNLRHPLASVLPVPEAADERPTMAKPFQFLPKKRPLWARFGRKSSPFELRPGAVESWMKARPLSPRPALDEAARRPDRDVIGDGRP